MGVVILGLVLLTAFAGLVYGFETTRASRENLRATQIMLERMEGLRVFTWEQLTDTDLNPPAFTNYYYPAGMGNGQRGVAYVGTVTVTPGPPTAYSNELKMVTVRITWNSGGVPRTRQMSTYIARWGVQNYIWTN